MCRHCLKEMFAVLNLSSDTNVLNKKLELINRCRHNIKDLLCHLPLDQYLLPPPFSDQFSQLGQFGPLTFFFSLLFFPLEVVCYTRFFPAIQTARRVTVLSIKARTLFLSFAFSSPEDRQSIKFQQRPELSIVC